MEKYKSFCTAYNACNGTWNERPGGTEPTSSNVLLRLRNTLIVVEKWFLIWNIYLDINLI